MADNTILQSGSFTGSASGTSLTLRSDVEWIKVWNLTGANQAAADVGTEFFWHVGMTAGRGMYNAKLGTVANDPLTAGQIAAGAGFTKIDTSTNPIGPAVTVTNIATGNQTTITAAGHGLSNGDGVKLYSLTGAQQLTQTVYAVSGVAGNDFDLDSQPSVVVAAAPGANAAVRKVYEPITNWRPNWAPGSIGITFIEVSTADASQTMLTVAENGDEVGGTGDYLRINIPSIYGVEIKNLQALITNTGETSTVGGTRTLTVDIPIATFTGFSFPTDAQVTAAGGAWTPAMVSQVGTTTAPLNFATERNLENLLVSLGGGALAPAGRDADEMYYIAGRGFGPQAFGL